MKRIENVLPGLLFAVFLVTLAGFILRTASCVSGEIERREKENPIIYPHIPLVAFKASSVQEGRLSGSIFMVTGRYNGEDYATFYAKLPDNSIRFGKVPLDTVSIFEDVSDGVPYVVGSQRKLDAMPKWPIRTDDSIVRDATRVYFHVPPGSVVQDITITLP